MNNTFFDRMVRAAKLDPQLYEEVEADRSATGQAATVVVITSVAAGIAMLPYGGLGPLISGAIGALIGWLVWAGLTYLIGAKLLPEPQTRTDMGELLRTIGFSSSPGIIRLGGIIPGIGPLFMWVGQLWMLAAMIVAVRQALDYQSTWRAVGVCAIGWLIMIAVSALFVIGFQHQAPATP